MRLFGVRFAVVLLLTAVASRGAALAEGPVVSFNLSTSKSLPQTRSRHFTFTRTMWMRSNFASIASMIL